jgi:hypothetical protein
MNRYVMMVLSNPTTGAEDAYNEWYNSEHVVDVAAVAGFRSGQRFRLATTGIGNAQPPTHRYLALYEVDADSPESANEALLEASREGRIRGHESIDLASVATWFFEPISERHMSDSQ